MLGRLSCLPRSLRLTQIPGYCTLCRSRCGTWNTVEQGRLVKVAPRPEHPTGRALCAKGRAAPEIAHASRRLATPLRRTQPKGAADPGWVPVSWEEALSEVAGKLGRARAESGAESVAFAVTSPSGTPISDAIDWIERFIRVFGSPNTVYATEICNWHKDHAHALTLGAAIGTPDYAQAELILLWGHNPSNAWLAEAGEIAEGRRRGAKLMVVDPRRNAHAAGAERWLRLRPGTDAALALGLIFLLLQEGFDAEFVRAWTDAPFLVREDGGGLLRAGDLGLDGPAEAPVVLVDGVPRAYDAGKFAGGHPPGALALRGAVSLGGIACRPVLDRLAEAVAPWTPAAVEATTGIPAADIRAAAAEIRAARRIAYYCWTGVGQSANATQTDRAIAILYALTGSLDRIGGNRHYTRQPVRGVADHALLPPGQAAKALGIAERPLGPAARGWVTAEDLRRAILEEKPYRVRALMSFGANLLVSQADPAGSAAALAALDFHVHCDLFENPTARFADLLLPVNSPWEHEGLRVGFEIDAAAEELVQLRPRMVAPFGQSRSDMEVVFDLACRLGHGDDFFGGDPEAGWNHILAPTGLTVEALRAAPEGIRLPLRQVEQKFAERLAQGQPAFATPSQRIEIFSERLLRIGQAPLPLHVDPPAPDERFPLRLTTAKSGYYCHSQHRGIASLRRRAPEPMVELHPDLAARHGVAEGGWLRLTTRAGSARFKARFSAALAADVLVADYGWWEACADLGLPAERDSNYNALIDTRQVDPISGSVAHRGFPCAIAALPDPAPAWPGFRPMRVVARREETAEVVSLHLAPLDGAPLPGFRPGQHLTLKPGEAGPLRAYSLSAAPGEDYRVSIRRQSGEGSTRFTALQPGATLLASAPSGRFVIPVAHPNPVVLVAAGIGITPFIGYLEALLTAPQTPPSVLLLYGNRDGASHAFRDRLQALAALLPGLTLVERYSRPRPGEAGALGRVSAGDVPQALIEARARFFLCGPPAMLSGMRAGLQARGVPAFEIFSESFVSPAGNTTAAPTAPRTVTFAQSGRKLRWTPEAGTLLELAEAAGLSLPSGCRTGQCESCAVAVLEGQAHHRLPPAEEDPATCLTCQALPFTDLTLDA